MKKEILLPKSDVIFKPIKSDGSKLWEWMRFLKVSEVEEFDMLPKNDPQIEKAIDILKALSADEKTRYIYEQREKARRDWEAMQRSAIQDGRKEGREEGRKEGLKEGRQEAVARIVKNALKANMSIDSIIELTGLSREEIEKLV